MAAAGATWGRAGEGPNPVGVKRSNERSEIIAPSYTKGKKYQRPQPRRAWFTNSWLAAKEIIFLKIYIPKNRVPFRGLKLSAYRFSDRRIGVIATHVEKNTNGPNPEGLGLLTLGLLPKKLFF